METDPCNPFVPVFGGWTSNPHGRAGVPSLTHHRSFPAPQPMVGTPFPYPHRLDSAIQPGAPLCDLPSLTPFHTPPTPSTGAIALRNAISVPNCAAACAHFHMRVAGGGHQRAAPAPSCRLCLTACNSRKFTWGRAHSQFPEEVPSGD